MEGKQKNNHTNKLSFPLREYVQYNVSSLAFFPPLCCWRLEQREILTQVQTELFCRRPHQPVILQIQYTRDKASVVAVCVCARACVGVRMQGCVCLSVSIGGRWKRSMTNIRGNSFQCFFHLLIYIIQNLSICKTEPMRRSDRGWITMAAVSTLNYQARLESQESSEGDKEGKCKCKTSHDRIWQETDISSSPSVFSFTLAQTF